MPTRLDSAGPGVTSAFRWMFIAVGVYDLVLGVLFFFFYRPVFERLGVDAPENTSYLHLAAGFVAVQGLGYLLVARRMVQNVDLVWVGVAYKAVYSGLAFYYLATGDLIHTMFAWFGAVDLVCLVGFLAFLWFARPEDAGAASQGHGLTGA